MRRHRALQAAVAVAVLGGLAALLGPRLLGGGRTGTGAGMGPQSPSSAGGGDAPLLLGQGASAREGAAARGDAAVAEASPADPSRDDKGMAVTSAGVRGRVVRMPGSHPVPRAVVRVRFVASLEDVTVLWTTRDPLRALETEAGLDGTFTLAGLHAGRYEVRARDPVGGGLAIRDVTVLPAGTKDLGDVAIQPGGTLSGTVTGADGKPAGGVRVLVLRHVEEEWWDLGGFNPSDPDSVYSATTTGAAGTWRLEGVPEGPAVVVARAATGEIATLGPVDVEEGRSRAGVNLALAAVRIVQGTVRDAAGRAVAGAQVVVLRQKDQHPLSGTAVTDAEGRFRAAIEDGAWGVVALDPTRRLTAVVDVPAGVAEAEVRLGESGAVAGRVVGADGATAVQGYAVTVVPDENDEARGTNLLVTMAVGLMAGLLPWPPAFVSDPDGRFRIEGVAAGRAKLAVSVPDAAPRQIEVTVPAGETADVGTIRLGEGHAVSGVVVDSGDRPLGGVRVTATRAKPEPSGPSAGGGEGATEQSAGVDYPPCVTDAAGRFRTVSLPAGRYDLGFEGPDTKRGWATVEVATADVTGVRVVLETMATLWVRVIDAAGRPAPRVPLLAFPAESPSYDTSTGEDGWARLRVETPGRWAVAWDSVALRETSWPEGRSEDGAADPPASAVVVVGEHERKEVTLRLPPLGSVRGRLEIGGRVAAGVEVVLGQGDGTTPPVHRAQTDATGTFVFPNVEPGAHRLGVSNYRAPPDLPPVEVSVPDTMEHEIDVALPPPLPPPAPDPHAGKCG